MTFTCGKQGPQARKLNDQQLLVEIREVHQQSKERYGAPTVHAALRAKGIHSSKRRVARLMRAASLWASEIQEDHERKPCSPSGTTSGEP